MSRLQHLLCVILCLLTMTSFAQSNNYSTEITNLTTAILAKADHLDNPVIGIVNFTNVDNQVTALGKKLSEEMSGELSFQKKSTIKIIDRNRINYWMTKEKIAVEDLSDPKMAELLSRKAMIDFVLTGVIMNTGKTGQLNLKIMNLKTGEIVAYERGYLPLLNSQPSIAAVEKEKIAPKKNIRHNDFTEKSGQTPVRKQPALVPAFNKKDASELPHKTEINNLEFKLERCKRLGQMVTIFFTITNKSGDITLKIDDKDAIIYAPEIEQLALSNFHFGKDISIYVERTLTTGVPIKAQLIFNNVPAEVTKIDRLIMDYYAGRNEQLEIQNIIIE